MSLIIRDSRGDPNSIGNVRLVEATARGDAAESPAGRAQPCNGQPATQWLYAAGWGVWMHYLDHSLLNQYQPWGKKFQSRCTPESWQALAANPATLPIAVREWNQIVDGFDVPGLVRQLQELQAGFLVFTLGQVGGFYCSPNATLDSITASVAPSLSFCSQRDLASELADELTRANIRLIIYVPAEIPPWNPLILRAFGAPGTTANVAANQAAYARWETVLRDWSRRFGTKAAGWWIDNPGGIASYQQTSVAGRTQPPVWSSLADALRAGNAHAIVTLAEWPPSPGSRWPISDYGSGECLPGADQFACGGRWIHGRQWFSESALCAFDYQTRIFSAAPVITGSKAAAQTRAIIANGGVCAWDVAYNLDGTIPSSYFAALKTISQTVVATPIFRVYVEQSGDPSEPSHRQLVLDLYQSKPGIVLRYTTDGTAPAADSTRYSAPVPVTDEMLQTGFTLQARAFAKAAPVGELCVRNFAPCGTMDRSA